MNTEKYMEMINLRRCDFSYEEIGNRMGVSRQYVHQTIGKRFRGDFNAIKRVKLREYFRKTLMSIPNFTRAVVGGCYSKSQRKRIERFLSGTDSYFTIGQFIRMSKLTGLNLEELAELERGAE